MTLTTQGKKVGLIFTITAFLVAGLLLFQGAFLSDSVDLKTQEKDAELAQAFLKFNILTHEGMRLSATVPNFQGEGKAWSALVTHQMETFLSGAPLVEKLPSATFVFAYKLTYPTGEIRWIVWYEDWEKGPLVGPDTTITLPVGERAAGAVIMSERLLQVGETEPLLRGYLVENGIAKLTITRTPIFVYSKE